MTLDDLIVFCNWNSAENKELINSEVIIRTNGISKKVEFIEIQKGSDDKYEIVLSDNILVEKSV